MTADPRMTIAAEREITYYENQSKLVAKFIRAIGSLIAFIMAIGAVFAALNTMYAAVSARSSEIATMRALGFVGSNIVVSFLCESLTIALFGAVLGCLLILPLNGFTASTTNMSTFSHLVFAFRITPDLMAQGLCLPLSWDFSAGCFLLCVQPASRLRQPSGGCERPGIGFRDQRRGFFYFGFRLLDSGFRALKKTFIRHD